MTGDTLPTTDIAERPWSTGQAWRQAEIQGCIAASACVRRGLIQILIEELLARLPRFRPDFEQNTSFPSSHILVIDKLYLAWDALYS
ncbi:MAG: hypothetical protein R3E09_05170 [Novosphingobium sp.]